MDIKDHKNYLKNMACIDKTIVDCSFSKREEKYLKKTD